MDTELVKVAPAQARSSESHTQSHSQQTYRENVAREPGDPLLCLLQRTTCEITTNNLEHAMTQTHIQNSRPSLWSNTGKELANIKLHAAAIDYMYTFKEAGLTSCIPWSGDNNRKPPEAF